jgi:hypothetical protein
MHPAASAFQSTFEPAVTVAAAHQRLVALVCSLPLLLKAKGRAAWDAVQANLLQMLQKLDLEAQVQLSVGRGGNFRQHAMHLAHTLLFHGGLQQSAGAVVHRMLFACHHVPTAVATL